MLNERLGFPTKEFWDEIPNEMIVPTGLTIGIMMAQKFFEGTQLAPEKDEDWLGYAFYLACACFDTESLNRFILVLTEKYTKDFNCSVEKAKETFLFQFIHTGKKIGDILTDMGFCRAIGLNPDSLKHIVEEAQEKTKMKDGAIKNGFSSWYDPGNTTKQ